MYIQYIGFNVAASSRVYNFDVIDKAEEAREFTVKIQSEAFRTAHLKIQDGPGICFERLEQELGRETKESRAEAHLNIGERDIQEYLEGFEKLNPIPVSLRASTTVWIAPRASRSSQCTVTIERRMSD